MAGGRTKKKTKTHLLFVYGSLMKNFPNNHLIKGKFFSNATTKDIDYTMIGLKSGAFPYVISNHTLDTEFIRTVPIWGEIYSCNLSLLKTLDGLEGHPHQYRRQKKEFLLENGKTVKAFVYILENTEMIKDIQYNLQKGKTKRFEVIEEGRWHTKP